MSIEHILAPFQTSCESAWIAVDMAEHFRRQGLIPALWSVDIPHPALAEYGINLVRPYQGKVPASGRLTVVGTEVIIGSWYDSSRFETVTLFNHQFSPSGFNRIMHRMTVQCIQPVALQYTNAQLKYKTGLPGSIVELPLNAERIFKTSTEDRTDNTRGRTRFTLGRITADDLMHHHPGDVGLYRNLAAAGIRIKILGGNSLKPWLVGIENIQLLAYEFNQIGEFLSGLDCIYFNTPPTQVEGPSQAMAAAMYMKLPIFAYAGGGYAALIRKYEQGVLFKNQDEAFDSIMRLLRTDN